MPAAAIAVPGDDRCAGTRTWRREADSAQCSDRFGRPATAAVHSTALSMSSCSPATVNVFACPSLSSRSRRCTERTVGQWQGTGPMSRLCSKRVACRRALDGVRRTHYHADLKQDGLLRVRGCPSSSPSKHTLVALLRPPQPALHPFHRLCLTLS